MKNYLTSKLRGRAVMAVVLAFTGMLAFQSCGSTSGTSKPIQVLMVGGGSSHDFDTWYKGADAKTLEEDGLSEVTYTDNTDSIAIYLVDADVLYLSNNQPIGKPEVRSAIMDFVKAGNGLVLGHAALWYNWADWPEYNKQLVSGGSRGHDPYGSFDVQVTNTDHPVTKGVDKNFTLEDELYYYKADPSGPGIEVLATASTDASEESFPSVFVVNNEKARIVGLALGHDDKSHNIEPYRTLLKNAVTWAANKK